MAVDKEQENSLKALNKRMQDQNEKAQNERENILGNEISNLKKAYNFQAAADRMRMADVKTAIDNKKKAQAAEEALLLATANNLGVTVDELKEQYKSIKVNPDKISELIFEPFENISKSLTEFEVGFGKNLSGASGAIKELTGGLIDLGQFAEDGADKVKAVGTLIATPFKLANTAVAKSTKFFTGKEVNFGQNLADWWSGTEKEIDGETVKSEGFKDRFLTSIPQAFQSFGESMTNMKDGIANGLSNFAENTKNFVGGLVQGAKELPAKAFNAIKDFGARAKEMGEGFVQGAKSFASTTKQFMMKSAAFLSGLGRAAVAMGRQAIGFVMALPGLIMAGAAFVAGLIATAASMLVAAAPFIAIGLAIGLAVAALVMGVMFLVQNFESIKTTISEKVGGFIQKIKDTIGGIVDGIKNFFQSISDGIRQKILKAKSWFGGLSDEEQAELDEINQRIDERKKKKEDRKAMNAEAEEIANAEFEAMKENGELDDMSRREKRKLKKQLEKDALKNLQDEKAFQETSSEDLLKERQQAEKDSTNAVLREEKKARQLQIEEDRLQRTNFIVGGQKATEGQRQAIIDSKLADKQEELDINLGTTEENRKIKEAADATFMKNQMELLTREDYVPSQIIDEEQVEADALGITKAELQERYDDDVDEFSDSEIAKMRYATDRADGDRIKDAADRAQEEKDKETADAHSVNMANNAVQQVNVSNNRKVVSDPAPHNPDPTGSRLSVVPA
jgi:hypothetical protein